MLLLASALLALAGPPLSLSADLPSELPAARILAGWERAEGRVDEPATRLVYELYVNPAYGALYAITRYRIEKLIDGPGGPTWEVRTEKALYNARPGREPIQCYERVVEPAPSPAGGAVWRWHRMPTESDAFKQEMFVAIQVYMYHRKALGIGPTR